MRSLISRMLSLRGAALAVVLTCVLAPGLRGQQGDNGAAPGRGFSRADTLRGSNTPERAWWDATFYDLSVRINPSDSSISGANTIWYTVIGPSREMQVDLQPPMRMGRVTQGGRELSVRREGNAHFIRLSERHAIGDLKSVTIEFAGKPRVAARPPWDGGFIWSRDSTGNPWISTANQGLGASVWWPNKDYQAEEPDSQRVAVTVPDPMVNVSNGRLRSTTRNPDGTTTYEWFAVSPINNYAISVNAGTYAHWFELFVGEKGQLSLDFWPLAENLDKARAQFTQTRTMMQCFEHWFGPYPWYEDGFKLIEVPYLGMEHQSAVTYGNGYRNGYRGNDLSRTGEGLKWDFIIVHEAAHEWWGNNVTAADIADNWIHEGFANYSEGLYTECLNGKEAGARYIVGSRRNITNRGTIIGTYGVQAQGSGDMYYKGGTLLHTLRQLIGDDERWRGILRGIQRDYARKFVTTAEIEAYISREAGRDFSRIFDQYLRTTQVPALSYVVTDGVLRYRWDNVVPGFSMPIRVRARRGSEEWQWITPTTEFQQMASPLADLNDALVVDENFYVTVQRAVR